MRKPDQGPHAFEQECADPPRKKTKKTLIIEQRYTGDIKFIRKDWQVFKRYKTERDRQKAIHALNRRKDSNFEYRIVE